MKIEPDDLLAGVGRIDAAKVDATTDKHTAVHLAQDMARQRCPWCEGFDRYHRYHDTEWGVPRRDHLAAGL